MGPILHFTITSCFVHVICNLLVAVIQDAKSREEQSRSGLHLSKPGRRINRQSQRDARKIEESLIQFVLEVSSL